MIISVFFFFLTNKDLDIMRLSEQLASNAHKMIACKLQQLHLTKLSLQENFINRSKYFYIIMF